MTPEQQVAEMERIISYTFNDRHLAVESLYHGGLPIHFDSDWITPQRNERLAIMGRLLRAADWTGIIRNDLVTNKKLASHGRALGLHICVIKDPGTGTVSDGMIATTFEAIIGAVFVDSSDSLDAVHGVVNRLGFFDHPLFMVTYYESRTLALTNTQMMINLRYLDPG
ncbi:hypothetical protein N0V91_008176 [Didymella pomorum]|uniref:RNase III domain-containing protein n=1 Tax=Didymella pomorum TaxID=749634 RepID=A0A9W9D514_9PLEO|nr:hypothetical protein N0V91_008176 [Didymella pomorum]